MSSGSVEEPDDIKEAFAELEQAQLFANEHANKTKLKYLIVALVILAVVPLLVFLLL